MLVSAVGRGGETESAFESLAQMEFIAEAVVPRHLPQRHRRKIHQHLPHALQLPFHLILMRGFTVQAQKPVAQGPLGDIGGRGQFPAGQHPAGGVL